MKGGNDPPLSQITIYYPSSEEYNNNKFKEFIDSVLKYILYSLYCIVSPQNEKHKKSIKIFYWIQCKNIIIPLSLVL